MAASPRSRLQCPTPEEGKRQSRAVGQSDPGGAHRAHPEVRLEKLPHILAAIVTAVANPRRFREAASAMGDLLDVAEGGVAVEPGEPAGGRNAQQEHPAWTQDASRFGQRLLLEHRQRQLVEQNNRVVRSVRLRPGDDRWHERRRRIAARGAAPADRCRAHAGRPGSQRGAVPAPGRRPHPAGRLPIRWVAAACSTNGSPAIVIGRVSPLWTRFRRSAMIAGEGGAMLRGSLR